MRALSLPFFVEIWMLRKKLYTATYKLYHATYFLNGAKYDLL